MRELWIVQPYVPSYRVPFFESLTQRLREISVDLRVVAGRPDAVQMKRGDVRTPAWLTLADGKVVSAMGRSVTMTRTRRHWREADAVIVPHMGSSFDALSALGWKAGIKVGVWGHIASYTSNPNPLDARIERWQLRRADHVFAYTPGGASFASAMGVAPERLTVVMNSVDTGALKANLASLDAERLSCFAERWNLPDSPIVAYLGGLDASKRIDFLADTLDELHLTGSPVHLVIGGNGEQSNLLDPAVARGQATVLGHVAGVDKAALLKTAVAIANPGRIGLLAVDALVSGRPILAPEWNYHAPEREYLTNGASLFQCANDPRSYAELIDRTARSGRPSPFEAKVPTLEEMVENFAHGIDRMLAS